jgi:hypothetical protein
MSKPAMAPLADRVAEMRSWALSRIRLCREQEQKFRPSSDAMIEAVTERRALESVLAQLGVECTHKEGSFIDDSRCVLCGWCAPKPDAIGELVALVNQAGGRVTLHGEPVTEAELRAAVEASAMKRIDELIARSSIGAGLRDIKERGIEAHLKTLDEEMRPRRRRKRT